MFRFKEWLASDTKDTSNDYFMSGQSRWSFFPQEEISLLIGQDERMASTEWISVRQGSLRHSTSPSLKLSTTFSFPCI